MLHNYRSHDLTTCLQGQMVFIGDSTVREIFWAMAEKLDSAGSNRAMPAAEKHEDITFSRDGIELSFSWDPYLNRTSLHQSITPYEPGEVQHPAITIIGGGLWHVKTLGKDSFNQFDYAINQVLKSAYLHRSSTNLIPAMTLDRPRLSKEALVAIAPVRIPLYQSLSAERAATLTESAVNPLNEHLKRLSTDKGAPVVWSYSEMTWQQPLAYQEDGLHIVNSVAALQADILLNIRCNSVLSSSGTYPMDKTCCSAYVQPNWIQMAILASSLGLLPLITVVTAKEQNRRTFFPSRNVSGALAMLALTLSYCYVADRTQMLDKLHKRYSSVDFQAMCLVTLALGVLSIRRSTQIVVEQGRQTSIHKPEQPFLSRDQTDEWKGWMQFLILIYHYTGASRVLEIYKVIRILVASYLFMTGFGHAAYFYRRRDYSLRRCASVLLRINLLSCLLPYIMRTDYLFYYFAPLTSFWYLVIFATMKIGQAKNRSIKILLCKMLVSALIVTAFIRIPGVLESVFKVLEKGAHIRWNVAEWRFRVHLDNYIVYVGMLAAIAFIKVTDSLQQETEKTCFLGRHFKRLRVLTMIAAAVALPAYFTAVASITKKPEYNSWVPYLSFWPILSYVALRNCSRHMRNYYSSVFAWLGRCSLETFTLQFHIWLAADTKGLLSLGFGRWQDLVPLTILFLWLSWHVANATNILTSWIVDPSAQRRSLEIEDSRAEMDLPRIKSYEHGSPYRHLDKVLVFSASSVSKTLRENLAARLALIVATLWLVNMLY
ncbi:MAG: hypothetical protein Q9191_004687 [Dirinaria sp. TL-2023a]